MALVGTLTMTVSFVDRSTLGVLAPSVTSALRISEAGYGWLVSAFSMAYLISTPLAGVFIERVGARKGLVVAVLIWSAVALAHGLASSFAMLFVLRLALGVAEGPSFPGASQTVYRALAPRDRPRGYGALYTGSSIGMALAPLIASRSCGAMGMACGFLHDGARRFAVGPVLACRHVSARGAGRARSCS